MGRQARKSIVCSLTPHLINDCVEQTDSSFYIASVMCFHHGLNMSIVLENTLRSSPPLTHLLHAGLFFCVSSTLLGLSILDKCILSYLKWHITMKDFHLHFLSTVLLYLDPVLCHSAVETERPCAWSASSPRLDNLNKHIYNIRVFRSNSVNVRSSAVIFQVEFPQKERGTYGSKFFYVTDFRFAK